MEPIKNNLDIQTKDVSDKASWIAPEIFTISLAEAAMPVNPDGNSEIHDVQGS